MLKPVSELDLVPLSEPTSTPLVDGGPVYTIQQNLDVHLRGRGFQFLVDWEECGPEEQ